MIKEHPVANVQWVERSTLKPNAYNPNKVAGPELRLLKISIMEDGWTQPIVVNADNEIVDGFHRYTVSGDPDIAKLSDGLVPIVRMKPQDESHKMMSTIRHNRARGTHGVLKMAEIVKSMIEAGVSQQEIERRLQMEPEEVIRLALRVGIPKSKIIQDATFSKAWEV